MLTDALAQFLAFKRWRKLFLIVGPQAGRQGLCGGDDAGGPQVRPDDRGREDLGFRPARPDQGRQPAQADALVFTRGVDYDVAVVADEAGDFGDYIPYRTWDPRPVAGTQGLVPSSWHPTHEAWGAAQLQNRFRRGGRARHAPDRLPGLGRRSRDRRGRRPGCRQTGPEEIGRFMLGRSQPCRLQGRAAELPALGPATAPADPDRAAGSHRLGRAGGRLPSPAHACSTRSAIDQPETACRFR